MSIHKELIEDFVVRAIRETLSEPMLFATIEKHLKELIDSQLQDSHSDIEQLKKEVKDNEGKIQNLIEALEKNG